MRNHWISALVGAALVLVAAAAASAEDFLRPINLQKGSVVEFHITRSGTKTTGGRTTGEGVVMTFRYRMTLQPNADGYRARIALVGLDLPPGLSPQEQAATRQSAEMTSGLEFQATGDLFPIELIDWRTQVDRLIAALAGMTGTPANDPALAATRELYLRMSPQEAAASLLQDWALPTLPQNMALNVGKPVQLGQPAQAGGVRVNEIMELKSVDRPAARAIIEYHSAIDPDSVRTLLAQTLQRLSDALPPASRPPAGDLAALKIEQSTDCRSEMDTVSGLSAKTDCTRRISAVDAAMKPEGRVDRWVITQRLVAP